MFWKGEICNVTLKKKVYDPTDIICRVLSEVDSVLGTKTYVEYEDLQKLEYIEQVSLYWPWLIKGLRRAIKLSILEMYQNPMVFYF